MMKNRLMKGSLAALVSLLATNAMAAQEVTVYTAFETDILAKYKSAFEKDNPDIKIKWVRDSTGIMTAKLLAEKNNPQKLTFLLNTSLRLRKTTQISRLSGFVIQQVS
ncbi:TPA: hypothetical protein ACMDSL_001591 [Vibrio parahaemolyticus]